MIWLSGLTCTDESFAQRGAGLAMAQRLKPGPRQPGRTAKGLRSVGFLSSKSAIDLDIVILPWLCVLGSSA